MFKHVIAGVDGAEGGFDAIALAKLLCDADGELSFAYIYRDQPLGWGGSSAAYQDDEREHARKLLDGAREETGVQARLRVHGAPTVGRGLHELAESAGADLLVTGSSRRGLLGRVLLGDDTRSALNAAPCAVAIAPAGYAQHPGQLQRIGVGYNGSPEAAQALDFALRLGGEVHGRVSAFQAVSFPTGLYVVPPYPDQGAIEGMLDAARERLAEIEGVEPHVAYGQPAEELAHYSASLDLLVIGSRSYGPLGRLVHGSTAQQLARTARCPLLVLTRGAREARTEDISAQEAAPVRIAS